MFLAQQGQLHDLQEEGSVYILPVARHRKLVSGNFHESELYDRLISVFLVGGERPWDRSRWPKYACSLLSPKKSNAICEDPI